jgi:hypothetical protein
MYFGLASLSKSSAQIMAGSKKLCISFKLEANLIKL